MPVEWRTHVAHANTLWDAAALLARDQFDAGGEFVIEFPPRRYVRGTRAFWLEMAARGVASPGDLPSMLALERDTGAVRIDLAQCAWGSRFQKLTTLLCSPRMAARLAHLGERSCPLCDLYAPHAKRATGTFADGSSRAAASGTYVSELCYEFAAAASDCPRIPRRAPPKAIELPRPAATAAAADDDDDPDMPGLAHESDDGLSDALSDGESAGADETIPIQASATRLTGALEGVATGPGACSWVRARAGGAG